MSSPLLPGGVLAALAACAPAPAADSPRADALAEGDWSATLQSPGGPLTFGLRLQRAAGEAGEGGAEAWRAGLVNGSEVIDVPRASWDGTNLLIDIEHYDSRIEARRDGADPARLVGQWTKRSGVDSFARLPFEARSPGTAAASASGTDPGGTPANSTGPGGQAPAVDGRWRVKFESDEQPAVAVFEHVDGALHGTFMTTTGDYRFLAGSQQGDQLTLSCFDGAHAFLFRARLAEDGSLAGDFWSRDAWHETWSAVRDEHATLPDGFSLTRWTDEGSLGELSFPDLDGRPRSLDDPAFAGQARILQVFGSWCPNCHDASELMADLHRRYGEQGLSIVGLAFELTGDFERDAAQVRSYAARHGVSYPLLVAGLSDKAAASQTFPLLDRIRSYPTTVFLHGDGRVRAVYQGFSGPATGADHDVLVASFQALIEELLAEGPQG